MIINPVFIIRSNNMENYKALLVEKAKLELVAAQVPVPKKDEVLVKIEYVGVCGSDVHFFELGELFGETLPFPIGLGHESAGVVVAVGEDVKHLKVGDKVALEPGATCGKCNYCTEGKYNLCPDVDFLAAPPNYKGALCNYMTYPAHLAFKLPENVSTLEGALVEPLAVGFHAATRGCAGFGKNVVILGAGCIGLMTQLACKYMGTPNITGLDIFDNRLEMAKKLGATTIVNTNGKDTADAVIAAQDGKAVDIVFECAGNKFTSAATAKIVDRGGKIVMVGNVMVPVTYEFQKTIDKEVDILGVFRYRNIYPKIIDAIATGKVAVKSIVSDEFTFKDVQKAFESAVNNKQSTIKNVVKI
jgi:L-iditol 2-dehydrogenase